MITKQSVSCDKIAGVGYCFVILLISGSDLFPSVDAHLVISIAIKLLALAAMVGIGLYAYRESAAPFGKHKAIKIVRIVFWICSLILVVVQIWQQRLAPVHMILNGLLIISVPLLMLMVMRWQQKSPWLVSDLYCTGVVLVSLLYSYLAIRTWITGSIGTTTGISADYAGWYSGSALAGCLIYFVVGILGFHTRYRRVAMIVQLLMAVLVFIGGSAHAILWLVIISLFLISMRVFQAQGNTLLRRMGLLSLVMLFIILVSPLFYAHANRRTDRIDPLPNPVVAADTLPDMYAEAKAGNHALGYLSYQDIQAIDQALELSGVGKYRSDRVLQRYLSMRYQTTAEDMQFRALKQQQFLRASLQSAGPINWLIGYGLTWFNGFMEPIRQGVLQIFAVWGLIGIFIFSAPLVVFLVASFCRQMDDRSKKMQFVGINLLTVILQLFLFASWDGLILHPLLLFLLYMPVILLLHKPQEIVVSNTAPEKTSMQARQNQVSRLKVNLILLVILLYSVLFAGLFLSVRLQAISILRRGYRIVTQYNDLITGFLADVRPGKWQPSYQPEEKAPMLRYEMSPNENDAESFVAGRYKGFIFDAEIDWDLPGIDNPSTQYLYHGMFWLDSCLRAWNATQDKRYIQSALEAVFNWIERFPVRLTDDPPYAWNDDSTARRVYHLCNAYNAWYPELSEDQRQTLSRALAYQADLLSQGWFYTWYHNHGLFQDRALLRYTQVFENPNNDRYQAICKDRIMTYVQKAITPDGVNTEHSPSYHLAIVGLLQTMADFLDQVDQSFSQMLREDVVDKMRDYAIWLVRPDGRYPPLGDSSARMEVISSWLTDPFYKYVATAGADGTMPEVLDRVYPDGGYAIFRNRWAFDGHATWVMFVAATHSGSHKHHDDLSFMIWHHGDLFTDGGNGGYDYFGKTLALYGVSPWAHSTLVSNWLDKRNARFYKYRPLIDAKGLETGITEWSIDDNKSMVSGIQKRIAGIEQVRTLTYDKQDNSVTIKDVVTSKSQDDSHLFLFQLAEGIEAIVGEDSITLMRQGQPTATIAFSSKLPYDVIVRTGDEDPLIQAFRADTGAERSVIGVQFDHVSEPLELYTTICLLP